MEKGHKRSGLFALLIVLFAALVGFAPVDAHAEVTQLPAAQNGVITLTDDTAISAWPAIDTSLTIDLAGHTLTYTGDKSLLLNGGQGLTVRDGNFVANSMPSGTTSVFNVQAKSSITLEKVIMYTNGSALLPQGDEASVTVRDSKIYCGVSAVSTNANTSANYGVVITLEDSEFTTDSGYQGYDGDSCPVLINVPGTLNMNKCVVNGTRQGVVVRGGTANISSSTINLTSTQGVQGITGSPIYNGTDKGNYDAANWRDGNNLPMAAMVIGNRSNAYAYPATCSLRGVQVNAPDGYTTVYTYGMNEDGREVTFAYDAASAVGKVVNPEGSVALSGTAIAEVEGTLYPSIQFALDAADNGQAVKVLGDADSNTLTIKEAKSVVLDLGGHKLTVTPKSADGTLIPNGDAVAVDAADVTLTLQNGTIENTASNGYGFYSYDKANNLNLVFDGVTMTTLGDGQVLGVQGNTSNSNVTVKNSVLDAGNIGLGVYFPPKSGTLSIEDSTVHGGTAAVVKGGTVNISGDKTVIEGVGKKVTPKDYYTGATDGSSTLTLTGDALYIESGYNDRDIAVNISGGMLISKNSFAVQYFVKEGESAAVKRDIKIYGGVFSSMPDAKFIVDGCVAVADGSGMFTVAEKQAEKIEGDASGKVASAGAMLDQGTSEKLAGTALDLAQSIQNGKLADGVKVADEEKLFESLGSVNKDDKVTTTLNVVVTPIEQAPSADETLVSEVVSGSENIDYLDLSFIMTVTVTKDDGTSTNASAEVAELPGKMKVTVATDADLSGSVRIARVHDGKVDVLNPVEVNAEAKTVTFETDRFSTYAILTAANCTVTFEANGGTPVPAVQAVAFGSKVVKPSDPVKDGFTFDGWFVDAECTKKFDFDTAVTTDTLELKLYAGWTPVESGDEKPGDDEKPPVAPGEDEKPDEDKTPSEGEKPSVTPGEDEKPDAKPDGDSKPDATPGEDKKPAEKPSKEEGPGKKPEPELPQTGDASMLPMAVMAGAGAISIAAGAVAFKRRQE